MLNSLTLHCTSLAERRQYFCANIRLNIIMRKQFHVFFHKKDKI